MNQLGTITLMELKRIINDRRRLLVLALGPVVLCLIFGYSFYTNPQNISIAVFVDRFSNQAASSPETQQVIAGIKQSNAFAVSEVFSLDEAVQQLEKGQVRGLVVLREGAQSLENIEVTVDVTDRTLQQTISGGLPPILAAVSNQRTMQALEMGGMTPSQAADIVIPFNLNFSNNKNRSLTQFDLGASGVIILFVVGISLIMASIAVTSERSKGTIERIFASPFKGWVIILSKVLANSLFAIAIAVIIWLTLKLAFDITMGNMALALLFTVLASINAILMGIFVSSVTYTELESVLGGIMLWFMAIFFMGLTWPLETMHPMFAFFSRLMPFTYALHSVRNINLIGWGLSNVVFDLLILLGFIVLQTLIVPMMLKREIR